MIQPTRLDNALLPPGKPSSLAVLVIVVGILIMAALLGGAILHGFLQPCSR